MTEKLIRKFRWYWAWEDEQEENWLHEMSLKGLHLAHIDGPGFYHFRVGEPKNYFYRLDFTTHISKEKHDYLTLFSDSGWDYLGDMGSWHYFRKEMTGSEAPVIFSDNESKIQKYRRVLGILLITFPLLLLSYVNISDRLNSLAGQCIFAVMVLAGFLMVYGALKIYQRIQDLRKKF